MLAMLMPHRYNAPYIDACNAIERGPRIGAVGSNDADHHHRAGSFRDASHVAHALGQRRMDGRAAEPLGRSAAAAGDVRGLPPDRPARPLAGSAGVGLQPPAMERYGYEIPLTAVAARVYDHALAQMSS